MKKISKPRIAWLTNLPAPYRVAIWDCLAESSHLRVFFSLTSNNYRGWQIPEDSQWTGRFLSRFSFRKGEMDIIFNPFGFRKIVKGSDVILVGGWEAPIYMTTLLYARSKGIFSFLFYESTPESHRFNNYYVNKLRFSILNLADLVITVGSASTRAALASGIKREKIHELYNPAEVGLFANLANSLRRPRLPGHHFLIVGQLIERKNIGRTIEAFAAIANPDDSLTIAGEGILHDVLEKQIKGLELVDRVLLVGQKNKEELAFLYANSQTLIMASANEVWGNVAIESLATGSHIVVSNVAGVADFVKKMEGVYICQTDTDSIALAMKKSREEYKTPIQHPEILAFTPKEFAKEILGLYERVSKPQMLSGKDNDNLANDNMSGAGANKSQILFTRLLTYPIIGASSLIAFRIIKHLYGGAGFNIFILIWTSLGALTLFEYTVGVPLTNAIAREGFNQRTLRKIRNSFIFNSIPVVILLVASQLSFVTSPLSRIVGRFYSTGLDSRMLLISISVTILFSTLYNIIARVANGISDFISPQIALSVGNGITIGLLFFSAQKKLDLNYFIVILGSAYLFACAYLILNTKFRTKMKNFHVSPKGEEYRRDNVHLYRLILSIVAILSTAITILPRWLFEKSGRVTGTSLYFLTLLGVNLFFSITSVLGSVFWVESIRGENGYWNKIQNSYKNIMILNSIILIPYLFAGKILSIFYNIHSSNLIILETGILGWLYLTLLNLHLIASNMLNSSKHLVFQIISMLAQLIALIYLFSVNNGSMSAQTAISLQIIIFGVFGVAPSYLYLKMEKSEE